MKKVTLIALCALALSCFAPGAAATDIETSARIVAGGGTPLTNGVFFPGTAFPREGGGFDAMPPVEVQKGTDFEFINLDEAAVANAHKIVSLKRRKRRPLFTSELLSRPGQTDIVKTSHMKPGIYAYYCSVHNGMWGQIQIVK